jgi:hypothetical protein
MRIGQLFIGWQRCQSESLGWIVASWCCRQTGYWRWALYWQPHIRTVGLRRHRSVTGQYYPHFGMTLAIGFGGLVLCTQPAWPRGSR